MSRRKKESQLAVSGAGDAAERVRVAIALVVVVTATIAVFSRTFGNGLVRWDDYENLVNNDAFRGLGWRQLKWMFGEFHAGHYHPLTWLSFAIDSALWGRRESGYHVTSVLIHSGTAVALFFLARRLMALATGVAYAPVLGAAVAAIIFAIHPLRVESVAWATERRDVLSGLFYVLTVLAYLRWRIAEKPLPWMAATHGLFLLALLSKVMSVTLPAVLIVLDVYPLRRLSGKRTSAGIAWLVLEKLPMFALSAGFGVLAVLAQHDSTAMMTLEEHGVGRRLLQVLYGLAFYVRKTVVPLSLAPYYELPAQVSLTRAAFWLSGLGVIAVTAWLVLLRKRFPALPAAWAAYAIILSPVSGVAQNGKQITADRYSYLACMGLAILFGYSIDRLRVHRRVVRAWPAVAMCGVLGMASLATLTWKQVGIWSDSVGLWLRVLSIDDGSALAWNNLGVSLLEDGNLPGAIEAHQRAYEIAPADPENCHRLAYVYSRAGRIADAEALYRRAIEVDPEYVDSRVNLAELVSARSQPDAAIAILQEAVRIKPDHPEARTNLANVLRSLDRLEEAESHYRHVIGTTPTYADAAFNLGEMLVSQQRISEAIEVWSAGVEFCPRDVPMMVNLSLALLTCPDPAMRDGARALEMADRACRLTHESDARALYARGQALRAAGRSTEALTTFRRARELAARAGDSALTEHLDTLISAPGP